MRKIVCTILIWLLVCLPVCASVQVFDLVPEQVTTAAAVNFGALAQDDSGIMFARDDGVIPLALPSGVTARICNSVYNLSRNTWSVGSYLSLTDLTVPSETSVSLLPVQSFGSLDGASPYAGFVLDLGNLSCPSTSGLNVGLNSFSFVFRFLNSAGSNIGTPCYDFSRAPFYVSVAYDWTGTGRYQKDLDSPPSFISLSGSGHTSGYLSVDSVRAIPSSWDSLSPRPLANLSLSCSFDISPTQYVNGTAYDLVSAKITYVTIRVCFPVEPSALISANGQTFSDLGYSFNDLVGTTMSLRSRFYYAYGSPAITVRYGSSFNDSQSFLSSSISTGFQNVNTRLNELKTTIQTGVNQVSSSISQQTQTLSSKLDSVKDGIVEDLIELKDTVTKGFGDVVQGITDLPGKIGEMLQGLIVPDPDKVSGKFSEFNDLAEEKLGVIYQVPEMVISMGQSIVSGAVEQKGEMTLPKFELIMPATNQSRAGESLVVWEEYTFPIWPEGTEVIHTAVQTATSMLCVILTFNALKRKYEDWLDGK